VSRTEALIVQDGCYFTIHLLKRVERTYPILELISVGVLGVVLNPPAKTVVTHGARLPDDPHANEAGFPFLIDGDVFDDKPNDLLSFSRRRRRRMPD